MSVSYFILDPAYLNYSLFIARIVDTPAISVAIWSHESFKNASILIDYPHYAVWLPLLITLTNKYYWSSFAILAFFVFFNDSTGR